MVDSSHKAHYVVPVPGHPNGIDGAYPAATTRSGLLVFEVPTSEDLGLILYGPRIGTQVSYFTIVPPTVPATPTTESRGRPAPGPPGPEDTSTPGPGTRATWRTVRPCG